MTTAVAAAGSIAVLCRLYRALGVANLVAPLDCCDLRFVACFCGCCCSCCLVCCRALTLPCFGRAIARLLASTSVLLGITVVLYVLQFTFYFLFLHAADCCRGYCRDLTLGPCFGLALARLRPLLWLLLWLLQ